MENKLTAHTKSCAAKAGSRFLALLLTCALIFSLSACGGQKKTGNVAESELEETWGPVTVERGPEPQAAQTASEATALTLRQYIYARLATEAFAAADLKSMSIDEIKEIVDETALAWETASLFASAAEDVASQAIAILEAPNLKRTAAVGQPQARFMTLAAASADFQVAALAAGSPRKLDPKAWAESLTKQYDALKGAKRVQQLAEQLGTDARTAYKQMALAQEIIRGQATADAAFWDEMTKAAQAVKTASKVGLLGISMVATGGGSVALLEGAGLLVGGVDCIVDVAETGSTIILGEGNQVAVAFGDIKDKLGPVSSLVGLATLNLSGVGKAAKDTTEALVYITDSLVDLFYEDKIVGVKVEGLGLSEHTHRISGQIFEEGTKAVIEAAGFLYPETTKAISQLAELWEPDQEAMIARIDALVSQMAELEQAAGITEEASPAPDSAESTPATEGPENAALPAPIGDINIFGRYSVTAYVINADDGEEQTSLITLVNLGAGKVQWIDDEDEEDEEDDDPLIMSYDASAHKLYYFEEGAMFNATFASSGGKVTGKGTMTATLWGERVEATMTLTKISD